MTYAVPTVPAVGDQITAAQGAVIATDIAEFGAAWEAYTPTITGYTSVTFSNKVGAFIDLGQTFLFRASWKIATVTTLGTTAIAVSLPFNIAAGYPASATNASNVGRAEYRTAAGIYVMGLAETGATAGTASILIQSPGGANPNLLRVTGAVPAGQVVNDTWILSGELEKAA